MRKSVLSGKKNVSLSFLNKIHFFKLWNPTGLVKSNEGFNFFQLLSLTLTQFINWTTEIGVLRQNYQVDVKTVVKIGFLKIFFSKNEC